MIIASAQDYAAFKAITSTLGLLNIRVLRAADDAGFTAVAILLTGDLAIEFRAAVLPASWSLDFPTAMTVAALSIAA
jgi:hypothetical protein